VAVTVSTNARLHVVTTATYGAAVYGHRENPEGPPCGVRHRDWTEDPPIFSEAATSHVP